MDGKARLAVFSRYIDAETCPVSPDAVTAKRGAKAPRLPLTPWGGYARTATRLPRRPGHARGRLQEHPRPSARTKEQAAPVPGGHDGAAHTRRGPVTS
jgi:hypothetical protein